MLIGFIDLSSGQHKRALGVNRALALAVQTSNRCDGLKEETQLSVILEQYLSTPEGRRCLFTLIVMHVRAGVVAMRKVLVRRCLQIAYLVHRNSIPSNNPLR